MSYISEKEENLLKRVIPQTKQPDFEEFWQKQVSYLRSFPIKFTKTELDTPWNKYLTFYEVTFTTHDDTVVNAYFSHPKDIKGKLPCVVRFGGGGSSRTFYTDMPLLGVCCFSMDNRSQGGVTFDKANYDHGDDFRGALMTHNLLDKESFYMRNLYLDAVRAIDVVSLFDEVDTTKIVTMGESQGGALSIVSACLSGKVLKTYPSVTSYACIPQRVEAGSGVFGAVKQYLTKHTSEVDVAFNTLSYFDINNMVSLLKVPSLFCLGMIDPICIPEFVYSAYHHAGGDKRIEFMPFTGHTTSFEAWTKIRYELADLDK